MNYFAIVHHDPGSAYGVSFPDVPDCFAAADDFADLQKNAIEALDDYLSDLDEFPVSRDIEAIRAEVAEDLAEGAFLLSVPYIARDTVKLRKNVSMERSVWAAIEAEADKLTNSNVSAFLTMAARNEILSRHGQTVDRTVGPAAVSRAYQKIADL